MSIGLGLYFQLNRLSVANSWLIHTYKVMQKTNHMLLNVLESESEVRGYLITGDEFFIRDLDNKIIKIDNDFNYMKELTIDNPLQQEMLTNLESLLSNRMSNFKQVIQLKKHGSLNKGPGTSLMHQMQNITDSIKQQIQAISNNEFQLLQQRQKEVVSKFGNLNILMISLSGLTLLLIAVGGIVLNIQLKRNIDAEQKRSASESLLNGIIEGSPEMIVAIDTEYKIIACNRSFETEIKRIYGKRIGLGINYKNITTNLSEDKEKILALWQRALKGEDFITIAKFGDEAFAREQYECTFSAIYNEIGTLVGATHIIRNVTKRIMEEVALKEAKQQLEIAFSELKQNNRDISLINEMANLIETGSTMKESFEIIANYCDKLLPFAGGVLYLMNSSRHYLDAVTDWNTPKKYEKIFYPEQCWALRQGKIFHYSISEKSILCKHVEANSTASYYCVPLLTQGEIIGLLYLEIKSELVPADQNIYESELLIQNLSSQLALSIANSKLREKLKHLSIRDPLTGLYNRAYLSESLDRDLYRAKRKNIPLAVVMMDLDNFKEINDKFGHEAGDLVLQELGKLFADKIRKSDIVCRYGGDEFIVILHDVSQSEAYEKVEKLKEAINNIRINFAGQKLESITASFGMSNYPEHDDQSSRLLALADKALYHSKKGGRNKITIFNNEI